MSDARGAATDNGDRGELAPVLQAECARCGPVAQAELGELLAFAPAGIAAHWLLCIDCYELLVDVIQKEISGGRPIERVRWGARAERMRRARERRDRRDKQR
jgi:hypothetical protein